MGGGGRGREGRGRERGEGERGEGERGEGERYKEAKMSRTMCKEHADIMQSYMYIIQRKYYITHCISTCTLLYLIVR